jgi:hypothetical protein
MTRNARYRAGCFVIWVGVVSFIALMALAATFYPGGTWFDRTTLGYDFWQNFWCDMLHEKGLNGMPNPVGARLASAGMIALNAALLSLWLVVPRLFEERAILGRWIRVLGVAGVLGAVGIAFAPSDRFPALHGTVVTLAGPAGIGAGVLSVAGCMSSKACSRTIAYLGVAMLLAALATLTRYACQFWLDVPASQVLPLLQKAATGLVLAWMMLASFFVYRTTNQPSR